METQVIVFVGVLTALILAAVAAAAYFDSRKFRKLMAQVEIERTARQHR
jgi:uncharacterized protein involved in outer membrane biogenesis